MKDEIDKDELGERIKKIRSSLGQTAEVFGKNFDPPANRSLVSSWENGRYVPGPSRVKKIAELGGISVDELLHGSKEGFIKRVLAADIDEGGRFYSALIDLLTRTTNLYDIEGAIFLDKQGKPYPYEEMPQKEFEAKQKMARKYVDENIIGINASIIPNGEFSFEPKDVINKALLYIDMEKTGNLNTFEGQYFNYRKNINDVIPTSIGYQSIEEWKKFYESYEIKFLVDMKERGFPVDEIDPEVTAYKRAVDTFFQNKLMNQAQEFKESIEELYIQYKNELSKYD